MPVGHDLDIHIAAQRAAGSIMARAALVDEVDQQTGDPIALVVGQAFESENGFVEQSHTSIVTDTEQLAEGCGASEERCERRGRCRLVGITMANTTA